MAEQLKKRRLDRTETSSVNTAAQQKFICCRCGMAHSRLKGFFPASHSPTYRGLGYIPICFDCIDKMYGAYRDKLDSSKSAVKMMCMKLDLYWSEQVFSIAEKTSGYNSIIRAYISKTNLFKIIDKTFDDTLEEAGIFSNPQLLDPNKNTGQSETDSEEGTRKDEPEVEQSVIDFWGSGYPADMYEELERHYADWTGGVEITDPSARSLYRQICLLEVIIARDGAAGQPIDKNVNTLNSLLGSMNLKPSQKKENSDTELETMPLGVGLQKWEYSRPLPSTPKSKRDVNGLIKNITVWFFGHLCKMVGIRNSYCEMYEEAMNKLRVGRPEYEEEDDDTVLTDVLSSVPLGGDANETV